MDLLVNNVSFRYGRSTALETVAFHLEPGRFHALLGANGSGKTTLFGLITRLLELQQGTIALGGLSLHRHNPAAMKKLGVVFQQSALDPDLTVHQNLEYHAALQGLDRQRRQQAIVRETERFGLTDHLAQRVRSLNGGHQRRVELARALLHQPAFLLLDEPTAGLDMDTRDALISHVHGLCESDGLTVLWATHLFDEVWPSDNVLLLHRGRLITQGIARSLCARHDAANLSVLMYHLTRAAA